MNIRSRMQQLERKLTPKHSPPEIVIVSTEEEVAEWRRCHPDECALFLQVGQLAQRNARD